MKKSDFLEPLQAISREQIPAHDFHLHTTWTDGQHTAKEMHSAAIQAQLHSILFSEHARRSSGDWFARFADEIRALPQDKCQALVGVEVKVLDPTGEVDLSPAIENSVDLVMASVHRFPGEEGLVSGTRNWQPEEAIDMEFRLSLGALRNPAVNILGHPFGMCYRRFGLRPPASLFGELCQEAARTGVAIEINSHYHPEPWKLLDLCLSKGARISLGSNAHEVAKVGSINRVLAGKEEPWIPSGF